MSLQECLLPVLTVKIGETEKPSDSVIVKLSYKNETTNKITTRRPLIEISYHSEDMFSQDSIQILLEARTSASELVGEAAIGKNVDPATGLVELEPGRSVKVAIRMNEDFEGSFSDFAAHQHGGPQLGRRRLGVFGDDSLRQ